MYFWNIAADVATAIKAYRLARAKRAEWEKFEERKKSYAAYIASNSFGVQLARSQ
jgi:hypothetical protein